MVFFRVARETVGILSKRVNGPINTGRCYSSQAYRANSIPELIKDRKGLAVPKYADGHCVAWMLVRKYSSESSVTKPSPTTRSSNLWDAGSPVRFPRMDVGQGLSRCVMLQFPKRTFIQFFLPRRQQQRRPAKPGKGLWAFQEVKPVRSLDSRDGAEGQKDLKSQGAGKKVVSDSLNDQENQNDVRSWQKKKQQSKPINVNLAKLLRISGGFGQPNSTGLVSEAALQKDGSFKKTKLYRFLSGTAGPNQRRKSKKPSNDSPMGRPFRRPQAASRPMLNYSLMQYMLMSEKQLLR